VLNASALSSRSRSSVGWRSSVDAEAECVTSDWTAVSMSSFLTALSSQHEKVADRDRQISRIPICVDRRMDSNTPVVEAAWSASFHVVKATPQQRIAE